MNVLIVDDSAMMRQIMRQVIQSNNAHGQISVKDASNGEEALNALDAGSVDLVLIDWNMPVLDGLSFVKRVRSDGVDIPIIMVTAVSDQDRMLQAAQAGVTSYIEKPIRGSELWSKIREYM